MTAQAHARPTGDTPPPAPPSTPATTVVPTTGHVDIIDGGTSTVERGKIEVAARRGELRPVGWAIDTDGRPAATRDAVLAGAAFSPSIVSLFSTHDGPSDLGHLFLVIDPATVGEDYLDRLTRAPLILEAKGRLGGPIPTEGNPAV